MVTHKTNSVMVDAPEFGAEVQCPYCGHIGHYTVNRFGPTAMSCDIETGGCDRYMLVTARLSATVTAYAIQD